MAGGSGSSGQQTQQVRQDPWSGQQPYLTDIFSQAQQLNQSGVGSEYFPGSTVVPFSPDTQAGIGAIRNTASQPAFGLDQAQGVVNTAMTGGQPNRNDVLNTAASGGMQNPVASLLQQQPAGVAQIAAGSQAATPYVNEMLQAAGQRNTAGLGRLYAGAGPNAAIQDIRDASGQSITAGGNVLNQTASGDLLGSNPFMDRMYDRAAERVRDNTNAAFSRAGRYGSGAHTGTLADSLGDMAAQMYGGAYETERGRQMQAVSELGNRQAQDISNRMAGASQVAGLDESRLGRQTTLGQLLGDRQLGDINRQTGAYGQAAGYGAADLSRMMQGGQAIAGIDMSRLGLMGQLGEADLGRRLEAANAVNQYGLNQTQQGLGALSALPGLRDYSQAGARDLMGIGQIQEGQARSELQDLMDRWQFSQQAPWDQLGRYSGIVGGMGSLGGTTTTTGPRQAGGGLMGALGGGAAGAGIASALSLTGPVGWGLAGLGGLMGAFG